MVKEEKFDVAVIGGGPSGIMAAITAAQAGAKVVLIEKNSKLGKKFLLTGNSRCNITNVQFDLRALVSNYSKSGEFLFHAFSVFGPKETVAFFEKIGVKVKIEKNKRAFPESNDAEEVLEALALSLEKNKVEILFNSEVADIVIKNKKISNIIVAGKEIKAKKFILCAGGKSYPLTGSNGSGFVLAEKLGHTIVIPQPALSPIKLKNDWVKNLQGLSLEDVRISVLQNEKKQFFEEGDFLFTQFGISGPCALNISGRTGELLKKGKVEIHIDLFPLLNKDQLSQGLEDVLRKHPGRNLRNILSIFVPERMAEALLQFSHIEGKKIANNMSKQEKILLVDVLKCFKAEVESIGGFEGAMVTKGGISLKEIDHKTMKSKIVDNLFFAGEIIDIDGKTGGFNLQLCWTTGYLAGKNSV